MCHRNPPPHGAAGRRPDEERVGVTTARPPHSPTSFALAARGFCAASAAIHHWHAEQGAKMLWAGDWKRPFTAGPRTGGGGAVAGLTTSRRS